jgi:hypothetical protein
MDFSFGSYQQEQEWKEEEDAKKTGEAVETYKQGRSCFMVPVERIGCVVNDGSEFGSYQWQQG